MTTPFRLDGEVAVVTGGSKGIGRAIAAMFAAHGCSVVISARNEAEGNQAAESIGATFVRADATSEQEVQQLIDSCVDMHGTVSVLVNNAGPTDLLHQGGIDGPIGEVAPVNWHQVIERTLTTAYLATHFALGPMKAAGRGAIVNISSAMGSRAVPGCDTYSAGKGGLEALTRAVAAGYAHLGIRCNAISAGVIPTHLENPIRPAYKSVDPTESGWKRSSPPPHGLPEDIAAAALYLASPASAYVTGVVLPVDGGIHARSVLGWQSPRPEMYP